MADIRIPVVQPSRRHERVLRINRSSLVAQRLPIPGVSRATRKQGHRAENAFPGKCPRWRRRYRVVAALIDASGSQLSCSGGRGIRKFDGQFPKRGGLVRARSN